MANTNSDQNLDDLLADIHKIIDDDSPAARPDEDESAYLDLDFGVDYQPTEPAPTPAPAPSKPAFWTQQQKVPKHVAKLQQNQAKAYADWLYEQGNQPPVTPPPLEKKSKRSQVPEPEYIPEASKKKRHFFRNFLIILLILAILSLVAAIFILPRQPKADVGLGARKSGVSTILLAGTDVGGARTDTLMLLCLNRGEKTISLVSIPRDTLVNGGYTVPKINSVYGANNGGDVGIDMLLTRVSECIGFRPDGYMLIRLDAFQELVDALGGVEFNVPTDMYYNDPNQNLFINLTSGIQKLTGEAAMGLVRFRSGYADADLGRVSVQRDFLSALIKQAVSVKGVVKSPRLLQILLDHTDTDLTGANFLWMAESVLLADKSNIQTVTLPGSARMISGGSYYVLDPAAVAQTVNAYCNPYEKELTADDLQIRQG